MTSENQISVVTVPISPPRQHNPGILSLCTMADVMRAKTGGVGYLCLNLNDGFHDRASLLPAFMQSIEAVGLGALKPWVDNLDETHTLRNIRRLAADGHIRAAEVEKLLCACGRIDCRADTVDQMHKTKLFKRRASEIVCTFCDVAARREVLPALVFNMPGQIDASLTVPKYLSTELWNMHQRFAGGKLVITKQRATGMTYVFGGQPYNIDVDFRTFNFLSAIPGRERVVLATSHVSFQLYMMHVMARLCEPDKETIFLPIAHIGGPCPVNLFDQNWPMQNKKLYLASAFVPAKETVWPQQLATYVTSSTSGRLARVFEALHSSAPRKNGESLLGYVDLLVRKEIRVPLLLQRQNACAPRPVVGRL